AGAARRGSVLLTAGDVDEDPALAETQPAKEIGGRPDTVVVLRAERVGGRVVGQLVVAGVLVEPCLVAERPQAEEIVRDAPGVAPQPIAHPLPRQDPA